MNRVSPLTAPARPPQSNPDGAASGARPTWRELIDRARPAEPDAFVARVVVPAGDEAPFRVLFTDHRPTRLGARHLRTVYLDQYTGERLAAPPAGPRTLGHAVMALVGPVHFGNFGGPGVRLVWLVIGLAPAVLGVTGLVLWWTRVVAPAWRRLQPAGPARRPPAPVVPGPRNAAPDDVRHRVGHARHRDRHGALNGYTTGLRDDRRAVEESADLRSLDAPVRQDPHHLVANR